MPLWCYDIILGIDWLEQHCPMNIHWLKKILSFQYQGRRVCLQGIKPSFTQCCLVWQQQLEQPESNQQATSLLSLGAVTSSETDIPLCIAQLLEEFSHLFSEPQGLPPPRVFDHAIPLLAGVKPVNLCPYCYNPTQKDEIEKQVTYMLSQGIIQPSNSPFSSLVTLVQKKDKTWRFCMDYRHLNAATIKNRYPLPIIDELLDELAGSQWFTRLDLWADYHQIRMKSEDQHKTTFKTHHGHFEFRVMSYGLTSAPATFQGLMNIILSPLLRKGVFVFIDDILVYSMDL